MAEAETISYILIFLVTFVFSMISITRMIQNGRTLVLDWVLPTIQGISAICWIILVPLHLGYVGGASIFLEAPAILWFAFGVMFLLFTIKSVLDNLAVSTVIKNSVDTVD